MAPSPSQPMLSREAYARKKVTDAKACLGLLDPADSINTVKCGIKLDPVPDKKTTGKLCHYTCFGGYCKKAVCPYVHNKIDRTAMSVLIPEYIRAPDLYDGSCSFASQLHAWSKIKKFASGGIDMNELLDHAERANA
eukprot:3346483-Amphidinium_carterae.1